MVVKGKIEKIKLDLEEERMKIIKQSAPVVSELDKQEEQQEVPKNCKHLWTIFALRIKKEMLKEIDEAVNSTVGISKTGWILQAIQEKLKKKD